MPRPARRTPVYGKRAIAERLLRAWSAVPGETLAQVIYGATGEADLRYVDDETLALSAELYASKARADRS